MINCLVLIIDLITAFTTAFLFEIIHFSLQGELYFIVWEERGGAYQVLTYKGGAVICF